jgi:23S rRNA (pseudouridine1915-N3)-methyltransferase
MPIKIICLGKTREAWIKQGILEYHKRLTPVWKIEWLELPDVSLKIAGSVQNVKAREAAIIMKAVNADDFLIALDEHGSSLDSVSFADKLAQLLPTGNIVFVIGGVYGLDYTILQAAKLKLSFSIFTFPHQLIRLILIEQLYRAWTIQTGKTYHY